MGIRFDRALCGDLQQALRREWLETNGLGGFAGSTIVGLNTRRYHGLLVAATRAAGRRQGDRVRNPGAPSAGRNYEIHALWHNALMFMRDIASRFGYASDSQRYGASAAMAHASFADQ